MDDTWSALIQSKTIECNKRAIQQITTLPTNPFQYKYHNAVQHLGEAIFLTFLF